MTATTLGTIIEVYGAAKAAPIYAKERNEKMTYRAPLKLANYQRIIKKDDRFVVMHRVGLSLAHYNAIKNLVAHGAPYFYHGSLIDKEEVSVEVEIEVKAFKKISKEQGWM